MLKYYFYALCTVLFFSACSLFQPRIEEDGAVTFHRSVPEFCNEVRGLNASEVRSARSEQALIDHYGMTFMVRFNDGISPQLYGTLYYQNRDENLYCMALPDGRFASFSDSRIDEFKTNVIQEICHPLNSCR